MVENSMTRTPKVRRICVQVWNQLNRINSNGYLLFTLPRPCWIVLVGTFWPSLIFSVKYKIINYFYYLWKKNAFNRYSIYSAIMKNKETFLHSFFEDKFIHDVFGVGSTSVRTTNVINCSVPSTVSDIQKTITPFL